MNQHHLSLQTPTYPRTNERGVALVVVLLFLILIMLAGVMAVRQSSTDLKVATADQVNTLLLQGADGANVKLEGMINGPTDSQNYKDAVEANNGIISHFFPKENQDDELIYCYNPRQLQTLTNTARIFRGSSILTGFEAGNCNANQSSSYISGRNTVLTQVSLKYLSDPAKADSSAARYDNHVEGIDLNDVASETNKNPTKVHNLAVRSTSALPSYNDPGDCYTHSSAMSAVGGSTLSSCLTNANVPKKQLYSEVKVEYQSGGIKCIPYGKGSGAYGDTRCVVVPPTSL